MAIAVRGFSRFWVASKRHETALHDPGIGSGRFRRFWGILTRMAGIVASNRNAEFGKFSPPPALQRNRLPDAAMSCTEMKSCQPYVNQTAQPG
jgi:hypothetical protein